MYHTCVPHVVLLTYPLVAGYHLRKLHVSSVRWLARAGGNAQLIAAVAASRRRPCGRGKQDGARDPHPSHETELRQETGTWGRRMIFGGTAYSSVGPPRAIARSTRVGRPALFLVLFLFLVVVLVIYNVVVDYSVADYHAVVSIRSTIDANFRLDGKRVGRHIHTLRKRVAR